MSTAEQSAISVQLSGSAPKEDHMAGIKGRKEEGNK